LLDFSRIDDLKPLARLVSRIKAACPDSNFVIAGAQARDLLLKHAHAIETFRRTSDVDFAFRVGSWEEFSRLREALLGSGDFAEFPKKFHKLLFRGVLEVDVVPFGAIERADRTIEWPPEGDLVMSTFGFRETFGSIIDVRLPEDEVAKVVTLAGLALLKLEAWKDRRYREPGKDAHDLKLILSNYLQAGNEHRIYEEFEDLLTEEFDYRLAGAYVLGADIAAFLDPAGRDRVAALLEREADGDGKLSLVTDMKLEIEDGVRLVSALREGFLRK
jgi:predicted nucleotidyltransferase